MINRVTRRFKIDKILPAVTIIFLCLSCGFNYIDYQAHFEKSEAELQKIHAEYQEIRWETIRSLLGVVNREGYLYSKLISYSLRRKMEQEYPNREEFHKELDNELYDDTKFSEIIIDTVNNNSFLKDPSSRNGILVVCDDKVLYNLIIPNEKFEMAVDDFISKNYNIKLANSTFSSLNVRSDEIRLLEPYKPSSYNSKNHMMIKTSALDEIKNIYFSEGLSGLSGYLIATPYYIADTEDGFTVTQYDLSYVNDKHHRIMVLTYLSLYDIIMAYHNERITSIDKLEKDAIYRNQVKLSELYYSSIKMMLLHVFFIAFILIISRHTKNNNSSTKEEK